jgi:hypothetical protein
MNNIITNLTHLQDTRGLKTKVGATADEDREGQAVVGTAHPTSVLLGRSAQTLLGDD